MKSPVRSALGFALVVSLVAGCSGSDNPPAMSSGPPATAAADDQHTPQSDALTSAEVAQVNQANAEPMPAEKPDL